MESKRLFAVRGATGALNTPQDIVERVSRLHDEILARNGISEADIVSLLYTITGDLTALNPAAALRKTGRGTMLPLFCAAEPACDGAPGGIIRLLAHYYAPCEHIPVFVYLNGAEVLRPDIPQSE